MTAFLARIRTLFGRFFDDTLPLDPEQREERDWTGETSGEEAERRQLELEIKLLEKQGKGGPR